MAIFRSEKVISSLPATLEPDTVYYVRSGSGFDMYVSDSTGSISHSLNSTGDYASAAQGDKADSAVQPEDLATVATSGSYGDLSGLPALGSAAYEAASSFASANHGHAWGDLSGVPATASRWPETSEVTGLSAALGDKLDASNRYTDTEAVAAAQAAPEWNATNWDAAYGWGDHALEGYLKSVSWSDVGSKPSFAAVATSGAYGDLSGTPSPADYATAAQGAKADSAVQPGDIGTAAAKDVAPTGDATAGQVVKGNDSRLTDSRAPTSHSHPWSEVTGKPSQATRWPKFSEVTGKPSAYPAESHTHTLSQITDSGTAAAQDSSAFDAAGTASGAVSSHEGAANPHSQYVQKVSGKGLSSNDYTNGDKSKLAGIESGATADQTKADIDALGVDAGTLGGNGVSYFSKAGHSHSSISKGSSFQGDGSPNDFSGSVTGFVARSSDSPGWPGSYGRVTYFGSWSSSQDGGAMQVWVPYRSGSQDGELSFRRGVYNNQGWSDWQTFWHTGNDGPGSGLNADKLDGKDASAFATSAQGSKADSAVQSPTISKIEEVTEYPATEVPGVLYVLVSA